MYRQPMHTDAELNQADSGTETDWISVFQQRITSGEFGEYPSQRVMLDEIKLAYDQLKTEGRLVKGGQRFRLIQGEQ